MTPEGIKEAVEVMLAHANGKKIEFRWRGSSNWMEMDGNPNWNWEGYQYRIKPQQVSIPATEGELARINQKTVWIKHKKNLKSMGNVLANNKIIDGNWLVFNPDTKCWEDWGE